MNIETVLENSKEPNKIRTINALTRQNFLNSQDKITRIKVKVNTLLWEEMPNKTTLRELDTVACEIVSLIIDAAEGELKDDEPE